MASFIIGVWSWFLLSLTLGMAVIFAVALLLSGLRNEYRIISGPQPGSYRVEKLRWWCPHWTAISEHQDLRHAMDAMERLRN